ncbi:MAG: hypothetical protein ACRAVC_11605 [Trichormus sp.]
MFANEVMPLLPLCQGGFDTILGLSSETYKQLKVEIGSWAGGRGLINSKFKIQNSKLQNFGQGDKGDKVDKVDFCSNAHSPFPIPHSPCPNQINNLTNPLVTTFKL